MNFRMFWISVLFVLIPLSPSVGITDEGSDETGFCFLRSDETGFCFLRSDVMDFAFFFRLASAISIGKNVMDFAFFFGLAKQEHWKNCHRPAVLC